MIMSDMVHCFENKMSSTCFQFLQRANEGQDNGGGDHTLHQKYYRTQRHGCQTEKILRKIL